jgi:hypothetical protein
MLPATQNKMPDYYGEKVTSVAQYRQWLKQQRIFIARMKLGRFDD